MRKIRIISAVVVVCLTVFSSLLTCNRLYAKQEASKAYEMNRNATSTTYEYVWYLLNNSRYEITTSYSHTNTSFGAYSTVTSFTNNTGNAVEHQFTDSKTTSSSVHLGSKVTFEAIELEAGGDVSYSRTVSYNTNVTIGKYSTRTLRVRTRTEEKVFNSIIQSQVLSFGDQWLNDAQPISSISYQVVKTPDWVLY